MPPGAYFQKVTLLPDDSGGVQVSCSRHRSPHSAGSGTARAGACGALAARPLPELATQYPRPHPDTWVTRWRRLRTPTPSRVDACAGTRKTSFLTPSGTSRAERVARRPRGFGPNSRRSILDRILTLG